MRLLANKVSKIAFVSLTAGALLLSGTLAGVGGGVEEVRADEGNTWEDGGGNSRATAGPGEWEGDEEGDNTANARVVWELNRDVGTVTESGLLPHLNLLGDEIGRFFTLCAIQPALAAPNAYSGGYDDPEVVTEWQGYYGDGFTAPTLTGEDVRALAYLNSVISHEHLAAGSLGADDNDGVSKIWAVQNWVGAGAPQDETHWSVTAGGISLIELNEIWDNALDQAGPYTVDFDLVKDNSETSFDLYTISNFEIRAASGSLYNPIGPVPGTQITVNPGANTEVEDGELVFTWNPGSTDAIEISADLGEEISVTATTGLQLPDHELRVIRPLDSGAEYFRDDITNHTAQTLFVLGSLVSAETTQGLDALEPGQITTRVQRSSITLGDSVVDVVTKQNFPASELGRNVTHSLYKVSDNTNYVPTSESECVAPVATRTTAVTNGVVNTSWTPTETGTYVIVSTYNGTTSELNVRTSCLDPNERFSVLGGDVADTVAIEISSDVEDNVVSQTERVIDNIHVALADETVDGNPSVWPTDTSGENLPVSINIHTYGPFDNVQGAVEEVPEGLEPVHTTTLTVTDEGTFPVEVAREAASDRVDSGFYTVVAEYLPSAQVAGVAEYIVNPVITNFFDPRETFSVTTTPGISTKVNKTVYAKGERVVDSIFQVGFSDNQGDFEGTEDFLADNTTVTHRLYFVGDGEVNDTVCIAENEVDSATGLAGNREYSVQFNPEKEGKYTIQSTFTGDDRNAPVVTECGDPDETFIVTELEVTGITGIWLVVSSVLIALGLGGLLYGNRRESEVAAIA